MIQRSEPMFNVPPVVVATVAVLLLVHAFRMLVLTDAQDQQFLLTFAFIPARYDTDLVVGGSFPGGFGADLWTFFSYAFLHADLCISGLISRGFCRLARRWRVVSGVALYRLHARGCRGRRVRTSDHAPGGDGADDRRLGGDFRRDGGGAAFCFSERRSAWIVARRARRRCVSRAGCAARGNFARPAISDFSRRLDWAECAVRARLGVDGRRRPGDRLAGAHRRLSRGACSCSTRSIRSRRGPKSTLVASG